jgi:hypothetical protein
MKRFNMNVNSLREVPCGSGALGKAIIELSEQRNETNENLLNTEA